MLLKAGSGGQEVQGEEACGWIASRVNDASHHRLQLCIVHLCFTLLRFASVASLFSSTQSLVCARRPSQQMKMQQVKPQQRTPPDSRQHNKPQPKQQPKQQHRHSNPDNNPSDNPDNHSHNLQRLQHLQHKTQIAQIHISCHFMVRCCCVGHPSNNNEP